MKQYIKNIVKNSFYLTIVLYIVHNILIYLKRYTRNNTTTSGATHQAFSLQDSLKYIKDVFSDYQRVSNKPHFSGKIAEIGPGDSNGVALMFLAHGASHVDLADRFYSLRNNKQQEQITQSLVAEYPILKDIIAELDCKCVRYYGKHSSGENFFDYHKGYDVIISRSVLEHVNDPETVLRKMYDALNPGGMLIHKVDLRDHGMFTPCFYPLKFLEVPKFFYNLMTNGSGYPNRFLFHRYQEVLREINPFVKFYVSGLYGMESDNLAELYPVDEIPRDLKTKAINFVNKYKNKFIAEFKNIPLEDLIVSSFFFVCQKNVK